MLGIVSFCIDVNVNIDVNMTAIKRNGRSCPTMKIP